MNGIKLEILHGLLSEVARVNNENELDKITEKYADKLECGNDELVTAIVSDIKHIGSELVRLRNGAANADTYLIVRTEQERAELAEAMKVIDNNLFDYHFQPIVSTADGEIYSYEALMRPKSTLCPSPYHIIKYAEMTDRLNDVEKTTFLNVLDRIAVETDMFYGRPVFINSIPSARLNEADFEHVKVLLEKYSERVVVEMTEQSEMGDGEFGTIKEMYNSINVRTAIDDYGTGYSNVQNLLRYMPDYVKIDRSLVSDILNNRKKRYFVREIIDFCHDNGILALAEGVETAEELQTVIHLGADLVQGYYTSRPSAIAVETIPYEIRQEIKLYRQEREDGRKYHVYTAEKSERIQLERMEKEEYKCILIGKSGEGEVTVAGTPGSDTDIHVDVANGFKGSIILSDAVLSNTKGRPCINIGENCDVKLVLSGTNKLKNGGIKVPESARLQVCGDGGLSVFIDASGYYAIGNDGDSKHGELVFEQGVSIESHAAGGVCIGSGLGGKIRILLGQFTLKMTGYFGVGIGAYSGDTDIELFACNVTFDLSEQLGVAIGSHQGKCRANIHHASTKISLSGSHMVGIGTLEGSCCDVSVCEASMVFNISADRCAAVAALEGSTLFEISKASMHIISKGDNALALGGYSCDSKVSLINADSSVNLETKADYMSFIDKNKFKIEGGRIKVVINDVEIKSE
ncbi:MAG: EAL domain-containing protein [Oscillospiraceae bacterium]|nr:EAL domain-containing protein [Oscillospiraceae bacterium]